MRRVAAALIAAALGACTPVTAFNAIVPKDAGVQRSGKGIAYGPDPRQRLDVYEPAARTGPRPVIVFFYGGSWASGNRAGYGFVGRALAARGFVVVVPDYRLLPQHPYPDFVEDGAAAVRWTEAHVGEYGGDPQRIVLAGHSAGAYIAAMLAVDERWLGADRRAMKGLVGLAGPYDFLPGDSPETERAFGAWPHPEEVAPIGYAGAGDPPALLLAGAKDRVVSPFIGEAFALALSRAGVPARFRKYPGVGHVGIVTAIAEPFRANAPTLDDIAAFAGQVTAN
ncbi:MAG: alpha/beta hydrolase [Tsuneonella sp.]